MFAIVKYANNQELLVNINVYSITLLEYLKEMCLTDNVLSPNETLDLATEAGDYVLELNSRGKEYAKKVMDQRGSYVLVKVTEEPDSQPTYQPLLNTVSDKFKSAILSPKKKKAQKNDDNSNSSLDTSASLDGVSNPQAAFASSKRQPGGTSANFGAGGAKASQSARKH